MEKKTECEIVQDLLLGYVDNTLNEESKKLVEKHLSECEKCRERLQDIKKDIEENKSTQKKEIDYLKKVRKKSRIKAFFIAIGIIVLIAVIYYVIKFIRISSIMSRASKSYESQNFYCETQTNTGSDTAAVLELYYKDGKYKEVDTSYSDEGANTTFISYGEIGSDEIVEIDVQNKIAYIKKGDIAQLINNEMAIKYGSSPIRFEDSNFFNILNNLRKTFCASLRTDHRQSNKEYYVLSNNFDGKQLSWETWIDKETGLAIKDVRENAVKSYYPGTEIVKGEYDSISYYKYEFDIVTDEDVKVPDLSSYQIEDISLDVENYAN